MFLQRYGLILAEMLIITLWCIVTPVIATDHTLNPGDSIQQNITDATNGDTIILNPGTYNEHDIVISRNITLVANISAGGTAANTIIDGQNAGRIIDDSGGPTIYDNAYTLTIDNLTLRNGDAAYSHDPGYGGAILISHEGGIANITSSSFYNCSATHGGAIAVEAIAPIIMHPRVTVLSSSVTNCSASQGAALYAGWSNATIHSSRIYNNAGTAVYSDYSGEDSYDFGSINASYNWWGTNDNPSPQVYSATVNPWLVLNVIATPSSVTTSQTSTIEANFTYDSDEHYVDPALVHFPDNIPVTYSTTTGSILPAGMMTDGRNTTIFTPSADGRVIVNATVDGQTVSTGDAITAPRVQSVDPSSGLSSGGTPVLITGLRFTSVTGVFFGTSPAASYIVDSDRQISAVSPAHALGIVNISVTTDQGTGIPSAADQFTFTAPGEKFAINPGDSIQTAIDCSSPGYTIILNPGAYTGHDIVVRKDITLTANGSAGGNAANTIIDGELAGGILDNSGGFALTVENLTFINGSSSNSWGAGAIFTRNGIVNVSSSSFINCSHSNGYSAGGAITTDSGIVNIMTSSFINCSSTYGSAIFAGVSLPCCYPAPQVTMHFSRISGNIPANTVIYNQDGTVQAENNWWGTNDDPSGLVSGSVTTSPWLVLGTTATPSSITTSGTSLIQANLTKNSEGIDTASGGIFVPANIMHTFAVVTGSGSVSPLTAGTANGVAQTVFTPAGTGTTNISATVDSQTVYISMPVLPAPAPVTPIATLDTSGNDDGFPSITVSPTTTGDETLPPMTVTVNIGGDSKAWQAMVTGTKLSELIVTGTVQPGPGSDQTAPPGTVYQYINLVPARYTSITKSVISFTVPQSWLDDNHIAPGSVVLYHQTANGWEALPTTVLSTKDGTVYFFAESTRFSLFAITGMPSAVTPATIATTQEITGSVVQTPAPAAIAKAPVTTQTTAPLATTQQPAAPSPLMNIILVIVAIGILAGGGFMVRRWWIRRQNPALCAEYD